MTIRLRASALAFPAVVHDGPPAPLRLILNLDQGPRLDVSITGRAYRKAAREAIDRLTAGEDPIVVLQGALAADGVLRGPGIKVLPAAEQTGA